MSEATRRLEVLRLYSEEITKTTRSAIERAQRQVEQVQQQLARTRNRWPAR